LLVSLHHVGAADLGVRGVLAGVPSSPALAEEIPALIELDLELLKTGPARLVEPLAGMVPFQAVFFLDEGVDPLDQFGVSKVYGWAVRIRHRKAPP
jgi:hypothetical protein